MRNRDTVFAMCVLDLYRLAFVEMSDLNCLSSEREVIRGLGLCFLEALMAIHFRKRQIANN